MRISFHSQVIFVTYAAHVWNLVYRRAPIEAKKKVSTTRGNNSSCARFLILHSSAAYVLPYHSKYMHIMYLCIWCTMAVDDPLYIGFINVIRESIEEKNPRITSFCISDDCPTAWHHYNNSFECV